MLLNILKRLCRQALAAAVFLVFVCVGGAAYAQPVSPLVISDNQQRYSIDSHLEMFFGPENSTINDITNKNAPAQFIPYDKKAQKNYYNVTTWLRLSITNPLSHDQLIYFSTKILNKRAGEWIVYTQDAAGNYVQTDVGSKQAPIVAFPLTIPAKTTQTFYFSRYLTGKNSAEYFAAEPYFYTISTIDYFYLNGIHIGVLVALIVFSFFIYLFLKDRVYLIYIGFLLSFLAAVTIKDGLLNFIPNFSVSSEQFYLLFRSSLVLVGLFYAFFAQQILLTKQYAPKMDRVIKIYLYAFPVFLLIGLGTNNYGYRQLDAIYQNGPILYLLFGILFSVLANIAALKKGYGPARYYFMGMIAMFLGVIVSVMTEENLLPFNLFTFQAPELALDIETMLQAIALAVRFDTIQKAELEAQKEIVREKEIHARIQEKMLHEKQALVNSYARFFPKSLLRLFGKKNVAQINWNDYTKKTMTVLFGDLRNFTTILEKKTPAESFNFINNYLMQIGPVLRNGHGFIDKYIGDAILALFESKPANAIAAAIDIVNIFRSLAPANSSSQSTVDMRIGIHLGELIIGAMGEQQRMDFAIISPISSITVELEDINKIYGTCIIVSEAVVNNLPDKTQFKLRYLDYLTLPGTHEPMQIFEVFDNDPPQLAAQKEMVAEQYQNAIDYYLQGKWRKALEIFHFCQKQLPEDIIINLYITRCQERLAKSVKISSSARVVRGLELIV